MVADEESGIGADAQRPARWHLAPSPSGLGHWLVCRDARGDVAAFAPPGVPVHEAWDDPALLAWRSARWPGEEAYAAGDAPLRVRRLPQGVTGLLRLVPRDAVADLDDAHGWVISATQAHADALERLVLLQEADPGEGTAEAVARLRAVIRGHREEAAAAAAVLAPEDRTPDEVARGVEREPASVAARVDRDLNHAPGLTEFAAAVAEAERTHGHDQVVGALTGLLYAKHHSMSWRVTRPIRQAHKSARIGMRALRRHARGEMSRLRGNPPAAVPRRAAERDPSTIGPQDRHS